MKNSYKKLATCYDFLVGSGVLQSYQEIIGEQEKKSILDLGCGTGTLLKAYASKNKTLGVDISPEMIAAARKKDNKSTYLIGDIRKIKVEENFDIIICAFDTINHFQKLTDWEKIFQVASIHLKKDGVFVFDFNTKKSLEKSTKNKIIKRNKDGYIVMQAKMKGNNCFWVIDKFTKTLFGYFKHEKTIIKEKFYPTKVILKILNKYFEEVKIVLENNGRVYIKAKKPLKRAL